MSEQQALLPDAAGRRELWWEAAAYLERAILLDEADALRWAYLGRYQRLLENESNALEATEKALGYDPEEPIVLEERLAILANVGRFDDAKEAIAKLRELEPENPWVDAVETYILLRTGEYGSALELIDDVIDIDPEEIWYHELRAQCHQVRNEPSLVEEEYRWIREQRSNPSKKAYQYAFGWAAYKLGEFDEALDIFSRILDDPAENISSVYSNLGLCYLARDELTPGEESLDKGIQSATNIRQLDDLLDFDLSDIEKSSVNWSHGARVREVLNRTREKIEVRRVELERLRSAEEELSQFIATLENARKTDGWAWIGAHAGLARLKTEAGQWKRAADEYQAIWQDHSEQRSRRFPESRVGLMKTLARRGLVAASESDLACALECFRRSLELGTQPGAQYYGAMELVRDYLGLIGSIQQYHAVGEALRVLTDDSAFRDRRYDLIAARLELSRSAYLSTLRTVEEQVEPSALPDSLMPVIGEVGLDLLTSWGVLEEESDHRLFTIDLPEIRSRIRSSTGVMFPFISFRNNEEDLGGNDYRLMLYGIPLLSETIPSQEKYCPDAAACRASGIEGQIFEEPGQENEGMWLSELAWEQAEEAGLPVWDSYQYMLSRLESFLRRHLVTFLNLQSVQVILDEWEQADEGNRRGLRKKAVPDDWALTCLVNVLQSLIEEDVPVRNLAAILTAFADANPRWQEMIEVVERVRVALRPELPGNDGTRQLVEVPPDFEERIIRWIWERDGKRFLATPPEEARELLSTLRERVVAGRAERDLALVVQEAGLRPFVWRLVRTEFPSLPVLAERELVEGLTPNR